MKKTTSLRPLPVKILSFMIKAKLLVLLLIILLFYFVKDVDPNILNAQNGAREAIIEAYDLTSGDMKYEFGHLIGKLLFNIAYLIVLVWAIRQRKFWWAVAMISLLLISEILKGIPLYTIICMILILTNPTRNYLKGINNNLDNNREALDDFV